MINLEWFLKYVCSNKKSDRNTIRSFCDPICKNRNCPGLEGLQWNYWFSIREKENYYKVGLHAGFSAGYLFSATSKNSLVRDDLENFKNIDYSVILGAFYAFNNKWSVTVRYTNSFIKIYKNEQLTTEGLLNFLWTFRADYHF